MSIFFLADTHFGDHGLRKVRGFASAEEMQERVFAAWAEVVRPQDTVYHLGDVAAGSLLGQAAIGQQMRKLPGKKYLLPGEGDQQSLGLWSDVFLEVLPMVFDCKVCGMHLVLSHYPLLRWNKMQRGSIQLYAHLHAAEKGYQKQMDVGVDAWNLAPVNLDALLEHSKTLPPPLASVRERDSWPAKRMRHKG